MRNDVKRTDVSSAPQLLDIVEIDMVAGGDDENMCGGGPTGGGGAGSGGGGSVGGGSGGGTGGGWFGDPIRPW